MKGIVFIARPFFRRGSETKRRSPSVAHAPRVAAACSEVPVNPLNSYVEMLGKTHRATLR